MGIRLSRRRLDAICEALAARIAGVIDEEQAPLTREDYEAALDWASERRDKRASVNQSASVRSKDPAG